MYYTQEGINMKVLSQIISLSKNNEVTRVKGNWNGGSWGGLQVRKRKGVHFYDGNISPISGVVIENPVNNDRVLTNADIWTIYRRCSDVRASIDSIVRRVATFDWMVLPTISPQEPQYEELAAVCKEITAFLEAPNKNGETWQELMTAMLTDTLCFDAGVLELVKNKKGQLQELVALRGSTIKPRTDKFGRIKNYDQHMNLENNGLFGLVVEEQDSISFRKDQLVYLSLFKNTASPEGNPLLESLINEVIALMRSTETASINLDSDEIPPGILVLAGIAGRAADEAKADLQRLKGQDQKIRVMTTPDPAGVGAQWLQLKRTPREIMMKEVIEDMRRAVYRTFGVMPVEMGLTADMPRATATVQMDVASSHLVTPILELLQAKINTQIIPAMISVPDMLPLIKFQFDRETRLTPQQQAELSRTYVNYLENGVLTRNEVREMLGFAPIEGGNVPTYNVSDNPMPVSAIGGEDFSGVDVISKKVLPKNEVNISEDK